MNAHIKDIENIFIELIKDKNFEVLVDGSGTCVERENIDLEDVHEILYSLTTLLNNKNEQIFMWDPLIGKLSYDLTIHSYIKLNNKDLYPPYLLPVAKEEMNIVGPIIYTGNHACYLEIDDEHRAILLIEMMKPKQAIFIKGKEVMKYLLNHNINHHEKCDHILFDYELDINIIKDLMECTSWDGHYNVQGIYFLDEQLDLNTVQFKPHRKTFIIEIRDEQAFYISVSSDDSYAFNLKNS